MLTLAADEIDFNGGASSVSGTSALLLQPSAAGVTVGVGGGAGTLDVSDTDIAAVISYTKNNWSNQTGQLVQPAEILAARK